MSSAAIVSPTQGVAVRMGCLAVTAAPTGVLSTIGLGSCVGLVLLDADAFVIGLAHIMLPASRPIDGKTPGKFADLAVPALIAEMVRLGASARRLEAALVGGAKMFASNGASKLDIGDRNTAAATEALAAARMPVRAKMTAGAVGRTVWVSNESTMRWPKSGKRSTRRR